VLQVGLLLEQQSEAVIMAVTDPLNPRSIQRLHPQFPPSVGQAGAAIEAEAARHLEALARSRERPAVTSSWRYEEPSSEPGCRANLLIPFESPDYPAIKEFAQSKFADARDWKNHARGIMIAANKFHDVRSGRSGIEPVSDAAARAAAGIAEIAAGHHATLD
jgi:hypothetical protein